MPCLLLSDKTLYLLNGGTSFGNKGLRRPSINIRLESLRRINMIPIIDIQCDKIFKIYELRRQGEDIRHRSNNLHQDLLRGIAEHGGVTGVNFCAEFLAENGRNVRRIEIWFVTCSTFIMLAASMLSALGQILTG